VFELKEPIGGLNPVFAFVGCFDLDPGLPADAMSWPNGSRSVLFRAMRCLRRRANILLSYERSLL